MKKKQLELEHRLALVRSTIRQLTPRQLSKVDGANEWWPPCTPRMTTMDE